MRRDLEDARSTGGLIDRILASPPATGTTPNPLRTATPAALAERRRRLDEIARRRLRP